MSRIVVATAAIAAIAATIVAWSNFVIVVPQAAAALAMAAATEGPPIVSPLKIMQDYRTMLPIEDWRPTN